uniref:Uncharacterized protein n=1 Tax=viral metagenome TaxID=1070528 RepID=A0A6M3LBH9_9ZZZZ
MTTTIKGELEIDYERGVIYFHCDENDYAFVAYPSQSQKRNS